MSIFSIFNSKLPSTLRGVVDYGKQKKDGSHDHRYNSGGDRTQAQKEGDKKLAKSQANNP